jgi:CheY-like chemotaxis protein
MSTRREEEVERAAPRRRRVLLADDDELFRHMVAWTLRAEGYDVVEAEDGMELVDQLASSLLGKKDEPIDLILTDVRMPGWSGVQVMASLRATDWAIPVIVVTAYRSPEVEREAYRLGAAALFHKPCELRDLLAAVIDAAPPFEPRPEPSARPQATV